MAIEILGYATLKHGHTRQIRGLSDTPSAKSRRPDTKWHSWKVSWHAGLSEVLTLCEDEQPQAKGDAHSSEQANGMVGSIVIISSRSIRL